MNDIAQNPIIYFAAWDVVWLLVGCLRLLRYVGYFARTDYDNVRYSRWFHSRVNQKRNSSTSILILAASLAAVFCLLFVRDIGGILSAITSIASALLIYHFELCDRDLSEKFEASAQTIGLYTTACVVAGLPILFAGLLVWYFFTQVVHDLSSPAEGLVIVLFYGLPILLITLLAGPISYFRTPFSLPIANSLNRSINKALRHFRHF